MNEYKNISLKVDAYLHPPFSKPTFLINNIFDTALRKTCQWYLPMLFVYEQNKTSLIPGNGLQ